MTGEFATIAALRALLPPPAEDVGFWIGDDAASIALPSGRDWLLLAADTVVAGVHADLRLTSLTDLGWKAMAASVSDVAAMGGDIGHAVVTVSGPGDTDIEALYRGIAAAAGELCCPVVGGDLTNAHDLVVTVAVTGYSTGRPVGRSGARPGDDIWLTGPVGGAAAGLRLLRSGHRKGGGTDGSETEAGAPSGQLLLDDAVRAHARPVPLLAAGRAARSAGASAMIDVSDGLTADLDHVASASGVGLRLESVPVHGAATLEEALSGGEDFQLAFCAPAHAPVPREFSGLPAPQRIGSCTADPGERTLGGVSFLPAGWQHDWSAPAGGGRR